MLQGKSRITQLDTWRGSFKDPLSRAKEDFPTCPKKGAGGKFFTHPSLAQYAARKSARGSLGEAWYAPAERRVVAVAGAGWVVSLGRISPTLHGYLARDCVGAARRRSVSCGRTLSVAESSIEIRGPKIAFPEPGTGNPLWEAAVGALWEQKKGKKIAKNRRRGHDF